MIINDETFSELSEKIKLLKIRIKLSSMAEPLNRLSLLSELRELKSKLSKLQKK